MRPATILQRYFQGSVDHKLATAHMLYQEHGAVLLGDDHIREQLLLLETAAKRLKDQMVAMEMPRRCTRCAARSDGCCSALMADNSDALLLLINMLTGINISRHHHPDQCCFLGKQGCTLAVKPIFCLNYNCSHILTGSRPAALRQLERSSATLLCRQTTLEAALLQFIICKETL